MPHSGEDDVLAKCGKPSFCSPVFGTENAVYCICSRKRKKDRFRRNSPYALITFLKVPTSDGTGDLAGAQATGASVHTLGGSVYDSLNALHVGFPSSVGTSVRMGNLDTESNALSAKFALCHDRHLLTAAI